MNQLLYRRCHMYKGTFASIGTVLKESEMS